MKVKLLVTLDVPDEAEVSADEVAGYVQEILHCHNGLPFVEREATWESEGFFGKQPDDYEPDLDGVDATVESVEVVEGSAPIVLLPVPPLALASGGGEFFGADE